METHEIALLTWTGEDWVLLVEGGATRSTFGSNPVDAVAAHFAPDNDVYAWADVLRTVKPQIFNTETVYVIACIDRLWRCTAFPRGGLRSGPLLSSQAPTPQGSALGCFAGMGAIKIDWLCG